MALLRDRNLFLWCLLSSALSTQAFKPIFPWNATGTYGLKGIIDVQGEMPQLMLGVASHRGTGDEAYAIDQQIFLGISFAGATLGKDSEDTQALYQKMQQSHGSCSAGLPRNCTIDLQNSYAQFVQRNMKLDNVTDVCTGDDWTFQIPPTCKDFENTILKSAIPMSLAGDAYGVNADCTPSVGVSGAVSDYGNQTYELNRLNTEYDYFTTQVLPIVLAAGTTNSSVKGGVICAETTNFTAGSRRPGGVPPRSPQAKATSAAGRLEEAVGGVAALAFVAGLMSLL
ncbi:MAG: hypothetical protein Q9227_005705 [Pyrenula ochraceoflavens]